MMDCAAIVLAAGKGTRMKSSLCKVLHEIAGRPMISYVLDSAKDAGIEKICVVVGHQADRVREILADQNVSFELQEPQLGTGHAVESARNSLKDFQGHVLILCGDIPLVRSSTLRSMIDFHESNGSRLTVMTATVESPYGYGRILKSETGLIKSIVEERDASELERGTKEINAGVYLVESSLLFKLLTRLRPNNSQGEYYLTDIVTEANTDGIPVYAYSIADFSEASGINSRADLAYVSKRTYEALARDHMLAGVTIIDPGTTYIDWGVRIGLDTVIWPGVVITGSSTIIGERCSIEPHVFISSCQILDEAKILLGSRLNQTLVSEGASVGPMAHLRPDARIGKKCKIGNFVEVKKTSLGDGSKASHLTYLGDSEIGANVNIGCGTITCNYDGRNKHKTTIGDNSFVGSDVQFVAPVTIGQGCVIGAGSTITKDVPDGSLAVTRAKQKVYPLRLGQGPKIEK
jgi:bifunctional UDP-N-acetylglucosamine pyrophosphorylase/glucosamine-1-phosphate N-acetyltransferase